MQINSLAPSQITEPKPAAAAPVVPTPKGPAAKPVAPPVAKTPEAKTTAPTTKTEITDVKPTGEQTAQGEPTFTLKVNGKEYQATQSEIIALAQKARGADAAMKEKAELEKLTTNLLDNFDKDTLGLLVKRHGKEKAKEMVIAMTRNLIAEEDKTPEQIELEELRSHKKMTEAERERVDNEKKEAEISSKRAELYRTMLQDIDRELNDTHLPKDKLTLTRVLNYLAAGKKANGQDWSVRDAVKAVEMEDMSHASHYAKRYVEGKLPSEKFREIFGDETFKKLNKEQISLLKNADKIAKNGAPTTSADGVPGVEAPARKARSLSKTRGSQGMSERDYRREHGSLGGI